MGIGLLLVYFGYGLAFWVMGLAVLLESGRASTPGDARNMRWLASFGILHGTHEWLEAFLATARQPGESLPDWLNWLRLALLAVSFAFLFAFALASLRNVQPGPERGHWRYAAPLFVALVGFLTLGAFKTSGAEAWAALLDAAIRYVLAVPAALLAAMAVWPRSASQHGRALRPIGSNLRMEAAGFAAYGIAQLFVHRQVWFPASLVNQEAFLSAFGIPIQAIRGAAAAVIALGLLRAMQAAEQQRQAELVAAQQARLAAVQDQDTLRRDLLRHVVRSQEEERARIARELHDDVAQFLSAFSLHLGRLRAVLRRADTIAIVDQLQDLSHQMSQSLYQLVRDIRPSHLDNLGLVPAIKYLLSQEYGPKGLAVTFNTTGRPRPLSAAVDTALFRVVQESLVNTIRHSGVHAAEVDLLYQPRQVTLRIRDHGRGFDPAEEFRPPRGWGLAGMRERVEALGGCLNVHSAASEGTTVEVVLPFGDAVPRGAEYEEH